MWGKKKDFSACNDSGNAVGTKNYLLNRRPLRRRLRRNRSPHSSSVTEPAHMTR